MRITGGVYKGRKIICPKGVIRPAMDRMRESLFAILGDLSGVSFLDFFSGSGVVHGKLLNPGGGLIIHLPAEESLPETIGGIRLKDKRKYGRSILLFYQ